MKALHQTQLFYGPGTRELLTVLEKLEVGGRRKQMGYHKWTKRERELVRTHYQQPGGPKKLAEMLGLRSNQIKGMALVLGITRPRRIMPTRVVREAITASVFVGRQNRPDLIETRICPGVGNGDCGKHLRPEPVGGDGGFIIPRAIDLVCLAGHRFSL